MARSLFLFPSSRVHVARGGAEKGVERKRRDGARLGRNGVGVTEKRIREEYIFVGVYKRGLSEEDRRRRERGVWWGKKQKSSRSWSGPGWSQAIRDHPESRGVQLGSRQSGAVGMRPSERKTKQIFMPSPFACPLFTTLLLLFGPRSLCSSF